MNLLILTCLLCSVVCSAQGSETSHSNILAGVTRGPGSGEGLQSSQGDDDELEINDDLSGGDNQNSNIYELPPSQDEKKKKEKGKGKKKNRHRSKATTSFNPEHTGLTSGFTSTISTIEDPCTSTHLGYCIHGYCKHIEELREPVCICMKGYDGDRCGIQTLGTFKTKSGGGSDNELLQTVLVIIAVVLSVISCTAILLMTCAHYRSHKTYMASFLGTGAEQEKLQKPLADVMV